jgi:hypothetical protein
MSGKVLYSDSARSINWQTFSPRIVIAPQFAIYKNLVYLFSYIKTKLRQIMNTYYASGLLLQYRRLNRKRTQSSPMTLVYAFVVCSGAAMLYLTVSLSHYV